jgi:tight adherence protein B
MIETASGEKTVTLTNLLKEIEPDKPTGMGQMIASLHFSKHAQEQITQAGLTWSSNRLLCMMAACAAIGLFLGVSMPGPVSGPTAAVLLAAGVGSLPYVYVRRKRKKRLDTLEEQFPEALDFLARSMRAGHAFTISLEMIGEEVRDPLGQEFRALFNEQNLGAPLESAMANFTQRVPLLDVRFFTSSVMLQKQTGGNLSEILQRLAYVIRERFKLKGQVKALSAHGRLTAGILTVLPVVTMLGLLFVAPGYLQGMADDPDGKKMIGGAIVAQILGNICIKKIINIKV